MRTLLRAGYFFWALTTGAGCTEPDPPPTSKAEACEAVAKLYCDRLAFDCGYESALDASCEAFVYQPCMADLERAPQEDWSSCEEEVGSYSCQELSDGHTYLHVCSQEGVRP